MRIISDDVQRVYDMLSSVRGFLDGNGEYGEDESCAYIILSDAIARTAPLRSRRPAQSLFVTVRDYLDELPEDRRKEVEAAAETIRQAAEQAWSNF